jgi:hypothetical protein
LSQGFRPRIALILVTLLYLATLIWFTVHEPHHSALLALLFQYGILLPVLIFCLLRSKSAAPDGQGAGRGVARRHIVLALGLYVVLALALGRYWIGGISLTDEAAYQFAAHTFLSGHVAATAFPATSPDPVLAARERFFDYFLIKDGKWFPQYSPGWPAVLAVGEALHAGWLVNPVLGLLLLWLIWKVAREFFDVQAGRLAILLAIASPFFFAYAIGMLSHMACACAITGALLCCLRVPRLAADPGRGWRLYGTVALMALLIGAAYAIRALTAVACGSVLGVAVLWALRRNVRVLAASGAILALGAAAGVTATLLYNHACTGRYVLSLYGLFAQSDVRGIAETHAPLLDLTASGVVQNIAWRVRWYTQAILLHNEPFLLVVAAGGFWAARRQWSRQLWVLPAMLLALVAAHLPTALFSGSWVGERYYYEAFPAVFILAAYGWQALAARLRLSTAMVHTLAGLLLMVQAVQFTLFLAPEVRVAHQYWQVARFVRQSEPKDAVVFFKTHGLFVGTQFNINTPAWKKAADVYMVDPGPERRNAVAHALQRPRWVVVTYNGGPQVAARSIEAAGETAGGPIPSSR